MEGVPGGSSDPPGLVNGFSRKEIFLITKKHLSNDLQVVVEHLEKSLTEKSGHAIIIPDDMKPTISILLTKLRSKYKEAAQRQDYFFKKNESWLNTIVYFPIDAKPATVNKSTGRPAGNFETLSDRSKRRRTDEIRTKFSPAELSFAAQMSLRSSGHSDAAKIVKDVTLSSPSKAKKYKEGLRLSSSSPASYDANEALALLLDLKLSKESYQHLRNGAKGKGLNTLYPPYSAVLAAKKACCPPDGTLTFTESKAEVRLQALLDHTVQRVLLLKRDDISHMSDSEMSNMAFICKWGFDGTSGQSIYKMKFADPSISDASLFFTSLVPLQLAGVNEETKEEKILWSNPKPSSTLFCRPLKLQFTKETEQTSLNEKAYYDKQIEQLQAFKTVIHGKDIFIQYNLSMTMIDGKVCNAITNTKSAQRCYLCQATSTQFNNIDEVLKRRVTADYLQYGLSTLHAWIRCFECCIHLAYQMKTKKWQARKEEDKKEKEILKANIQKAFKEHLGILIDMPKQGFGSTNDGNTARRFFENTPTSALITGVSEELIHRFHIILQTISSGRQIDVEKFRAYAIATARHYVKEYPWYNMPTAVHRLLIHGPDIISSAILPIGQLSEDAQESTNKLIKQYRLSFSRKFSRVKTMEDVFRRLLASTDPYISSLRKPSPKKLKSLSPEAVALLVPVAEDYEDSDGDDEETVFEDDDDSVDEAEKEKEENDEDEKEEENDNF